MFTEMSSETGDYAINWDDVPPIQTPEQIEAADAYARSQGQFYYEDCDWCAICGRATDHFGEHSDEQIEAWRSGEVAR
jgi:hypothetical protein